MELNGDGGWWERMKDREREREKKDEEEWRWLSEIHGQNKGIEKDPKFLDTVPITASLNDENGRELERECWKTGS